MTGDDDRDTGGKITFTYYPGCSSQGSARHLDESLRAIAPEIGLELVELDDWNCCGASVGQIGGGALPNTALTGRNLAKAAAQGPRDVVTGCAACYLNTHAGNEKIKSDVAMRARVNEALGAAELSYDDDLEVRHVCEVIVNDVGIDKVAVRVSNPLTGLRWRAMSAARRFGPLPPPMAVATTIPTKTRISWTISPAPAVPRRSSSILRPPAAAAPSR